MKKLFTGIILGALTINVALAQDLENQWQNRGQGMKFGQSAEFKNLSSEERHAKMLEAYNSATPEQKARMDQQRTLNQAKAKELGLDLNTPDGRQKFQAYRQQNRGQGMGMGKGKGQRNGKGMGRNR